MLAIVVTCAFSAHATEIGTERTLGIGPVVGTATGASGRAYVGGRRVAFDFAFGAASGADAFDATFGHLSVLGTFGNREADGVRVPWHVGLGAFVSSRDADLDEGATALGIRLPIGLDLDLEAVPVQLTVELSPVTLSLTPTTRFGLDAGVALRYYL